MNNNDTIKLLCECDAGIKMGVTAIDEVMGGAKSDKMRQKLCRVQIGARDAQG